LGIKNIEEANFGKPKEFFAKNKSLLAAITRGDKGCVIFKDNNSFEFAAEKITNLLDTTGAGDCFAAGLLFGINNNFTLDKSAKLANLIASRIIQKFGARFENFELNEIKNAI